MNGPTTSMIILFSIMSIGIVAFILSLYFEAQKYKQNANLIDQTQDISTKIMLNLKRLMRYQELLEKIPSETELTSSLESLIALRLINKTASFAKNLDIYYLTKDGLIWVDEELS